VFASCPGGSSTTNVQTINSGYGVTNPTLSGTAIAPSINTGTLIESVYSNPGTGYLSYNGTNIGFESSGGNTSIFPPVVKSLTGNIGANGSTNCIPGAANTGGGATGGYSTTSGTAYTGAIGGSGLVTVTEYF
jgi:hypothetical protein